MTEFAFSFLKKQAVVAQISDKNSRNNIARDNNNEYKIPNSQVILLEDRKRANDFEKAEKYGSEILEYLHDIKLGMANGELGENHIINLKNILEKNRSLFKISKLTDMIDDIILQLEDKIKESN